MLWLRVFKPICSAGNKAVWKGAPEGFKRRMEIGAKPQNRGGKGKRGSTQRDLGKRKSRADTSARFGRGGMAFASTRMRAGIAMAAPKGGRYEEYYYGRDEQ